MARSRDLGRTPSQESTIEFICSAARAKGYACEVVSEPRSSTEGAGLRVSRTKDDWQKMGITPEGDAIRTGMSSGYYGKDTDKLSRFVSTIAKKARKR